MVSAPLPGFPPEVAELLGLRSAAPALITADRTFSHAEIRVHAEQVGGILRAQGIGPGRRVGLMLGNVPEFLVAFLAVAGLGGSAVLLSTYFRTYELKQNCGMLGLEMILATESCRETLSSVSPGLQEDPARFDGFESLRLFRLSAAPGGVSAGPEGEMVVQFTSGVGGVSKAVGRTRDNIADELRNFCAATGLSDCDRILCMTPLFHAYGLVNGFLPAFFRGACLVLAERFLPRDVLGLALKHRPTVILGVPLMYELLVQLDRVADGAFADTRFCFSAGARLLTTTALAFRNLFGRPIGQLYGSTETGVIAFNHGRAAEEYPESVGHAVPGRDIRVIGEGDGAGAGEICIRSAGTAPFYIGAPALTAQAFDDGWYHSGDLGEVNCDGLIRITGRKSTFINVGGMKVDPFEVETVLRAIPGVQDAVVVGIPHKDPSYSGELVKAFVVGAPDLSRKSLLRACHEQIAEYKVPREVEFLGELPRTPMGKVLRKYLVNE